MQQKYPGILRLQCGVVENEIWITNLLSDCINLKYNRDWFRIFAVQLLTYKTTVKRQGLDR